MLMEALQYKFPSTSRPNIRLADIENGLSCWEE